MYTRSFPSVSLIVPCLNEERHIATCLDSIVANDYPKEKLEVFVVDGCSRDKTREIVEKYTQQYSFIKLLDNPKVTTPAAMNIGIKNAKGDVIMKMDAHSVYAKDYISKCVEHLQESGADNVGGVLKSVPADNTLTAKSIAICLSHIFGAGSSYFRTGTAESKEVDTVAFGCYKKEVFQKIGLYDERMIKSEDIELNYRLRKAGGKIMLFPDIKALYYPSSDNLKSFFKHNVVDGIWTTYPLKYGLRLSFRHFIPLIFVATILLSVWPYILVSLFFSVKVALDEKDWRLLFAMPLVFGIRHIGYGLGSIVGLVKLLKP